MAMNVPVVSSNLGGVPELVINGETGLMVEPGDQAQLVSAIKEIWLNQRLYWKMEENTRKLIEEKFNKAVQFDKFIEHFYKITQPDQ
jgi:glycosyltransferase involved in cell wall biosynthesis